METAESAVIAAPAEKKTYNKNIPWEKIEAELIAGNKPMEVCRKYGVKYHTVRVHLNRNKIVIPSQKLMRNVQKNMEKSIIVATEKVAQSWLERQDAHREIAFDRAHRSVEMFKAKKPTSFRELEAADKIARRASGLETADVIQQTLVNVNEAIEGYEVKEATPAQVVDSPS